MRKIKDGHGTGNITIYDLFFALGEIKENVYFR